MLKTCVFINFFDMFDSNLLKTCVFIYFFDIFESNLLKTCVFIDFFDFVDFFRSSKSGQPIPDSAPEQLKNIGFP